VVVVEEQVDLMLHQALEPLVVLAVAVVVMENLDLIVPINQVVHLLLLRQHTLYIHLLDMVMLVDVVVKMAVAVVVLELWDQLVMPLEMVRQDMQFLPSHIH
jgi:hypothetical protein